MKGFGDTIKSWRKKRNLSQMELGFQADVSSKHISFLENGRSQPSREMVLHLAHVLDIPLAERNALLTLSGYSEAYRRNALSDEALAPVQHALSRMLDKHNPYPAFVLDWEWNIVMMNQTQMQLSALVQSAQPGFEQSNNLIDLVFSPRGFKPIIQNFDDVAFHLIQRLRKEHAYYQDRESDLLKRVEEHWGYPTHSTLSPTQATAPIINLELKLGELELSMFSTLASFGTPIDITVQELVIEQYFPADDATEAFFKNLSA